MSFAVKEIYYTIQGEGVHTGRPAVFVRFAGCNLWTGREDGRSRAVCQFCDTDFVGVDGPGGGNFPEAAGLAEAIRACWLAGAGAALPPFVVLTGGEPSLQVSAGLIEALHVEGFEIAIETNGTRALPAGIDWICVSPKAGAELVVTGGDELKLVYPQQGAAPEDFVSLPFKHFFLQPMDGPDLEWNVALVRDYCLAHPRWRVSIQVHKLLGVR